MGMGYGERVGIDQQRDDPCSISILFYSICALFLFYLCSIPISILSTLYFYLYLFPFYSIDALFLVSRLRWNVQNHMEANLESYRNFPRLLIECGRKNLHFIHQSADIDTVVAQTTRSAFEYTGQRCSACERLHVADTIRPQVKEGKFLQSPRLRKKSPECWLIGSAVNSWCQLLILSSSVQYSSKHRKNWKSDLSWTFPILRQLSSTKLLSRKSLSTWTTRNRKNTILADGKVPRMVHRSHHCSSARSRRPVSTSTLRHDVFLADKSRIIIILQGALFAY